MSFVLDTCDLTRNAALKFSSIKWVGLHAILNLRAHRYVRREPAQYVHMYMYTQGRIQEFKKGGGSLKECARGARR